MTEWREILVAHAARYRAMTPCDAVKLLYQSEFGGGHMIPDPEAAARRLRTEYEAYEETEASPCFEPIGGGFVRVYLSAVGRALITLDDLNALFVASAEQTRGSISSFESKLEVLRTLTAEGLFSFDEAALTAYLDDYRRSGYPPVSHSESYRAAYRPAYRIVLATGLKNICTL